jgi:hypothetical protein
MPLQRESAHEGEDDEVLIDVDGNGHNEEEQDGGAAATPGITAGGCSGMGPPAVLPGGGVTGYGPSAFTRGLLGHRPEFVH